MREKRAKKNQTNEKKKRRFDFRKLFCYVLLEHKFGFTRLQSYAECYNAQVECIWMDSFCHVSLFSPKKHETICFHNELIFPKLSNLILFAWYQNEKLFSLCYISSSLRQVSRIFKWHEILNEIECFFKQLTIFRFFVRHRIVTKFKWKIKINIYKKLNKMGFLWRHSKQQQQRKYKWI